MTFHTIVLEEHSLVLGGAKHRFQPLNPLDHPHQAGPVGQVALVGTNAGGNIAATAYVDHAAGTIAEDVDAGLVREQGECSSHGRRQCGRSARHLGALKAIG